ncbi:MAG: hypothetical protein M0R46_10005 [Candidatus Muirbacterium halophilum]|nr:hypothetical protein [Candidatus Muirbacterium halophilum]
MAKKITTTIRDIADKMILFADENEVTEIQDLINFIFTQIENNILTNSITIHNFFSLEIKKRKGYNGQFYIDCNVSKTFKKLIKDTTIEEDNHNIISFGQLDSYCHEYDVEFFGTFFEKAKTLQYSEKIKFYYCFITKVFNVIKNLVINNNTFSTNFGYFSLKYNKIYGYYMNFKNNDIFKSNINEHFNKILTT